MSLTRAQFESACKAYIEKYSARHEHGTDEALLKRYPTGWSWIEHTVRSAFLRLEQSLSLVSVGCWSGLSISKSVYSVTNTRVSRRRPGRP